ncbi:MAG: VOC family protein [Steroidobacteraceae bacterium]
MSKLAHVCIETADLEITEKFYRCLGLRRQFEFRNNDGLLIGFYLKFADRSFIEVVLVVRARPEGGLRHFAIESDDIDSVRQSLLAAGYTASERVRGKDRTWMVTTRDPNGIFIELHQYTDESMQIAGGTCVMDYEPRP